MYIWRRGHKCITKETSIKLTLDYSKTEKDLGERPFIDFAALLVNLKFPQTVCTRFCRDNYYYYFQFRKKKIKRISFSLINKI